MNDFADNATTAGHEPIETNVRAVWLTAAVLTTVVVVAFGAIFGLIRWLAVSEGRAPESQASTPDIDWDAPRQLQQLRRREQAILSTFAWVNEAEGVARIPIQRAMSIVAQAGIPIAVGGTQTSGSSAAPRASNGSSSEPEADQP